MLAFFIHRIRGISLGDKTSEQLKLLAQAQECVGNASDIIEQWEYSQKNVEQATFDVINISDLALRLSKQGKELMLNIQDQYEQMLEQNINNRKEIETLIAETMAVFQQLREVALTTSNTAHILEKEVVIQREAVKNMVHTIEHISGSVNQTVACAEFYDLLEFHTQREAWIE